MLHIIVFCLNRAILCDHLLRSMERHLAASCDKISVTLLYGATNERYEQGFTILKQRFAGRVAFVRKHHGLWRTPLTLLLRPRNLYYYLKNPYYRDTARIFNFKPLLEEIMAQSTCEYVTFLTDDSFFYKDVDIASAIGRLSGENSHQNSFSLRLGANIRNAPTHMRRNEKFIRWDFGNQEGTGHWSYRFSIDGHIYHRKYMLEFIRNILYVNPNTFEAVVERHAELRGVLSFGHGFEEAVLAGAEINRVQDVSANNNLGIDNVMLNDYFLKGYRLRMITETPINDFHPRISYLAMSKPENGSERVLFAGKRTETDAGGSATNIAP